MPARELPLSLQLIHMIFIPRAYPRTLDNKKKPNDILSSVGPRALCSRCVGWFVFRVQSEKKRHTRMEENGRKFHVELVCLSAYTSNKCMLAGTKLARTSRASLSIRTKFD